VAVVDRRRTSVRLLGLDAGRVGDVMTPGDPPPYVGEALFILAALWIVAALAVGIWELK
jgi:hypothetical protein